MNAGNAQFFPCIQQMFTNRGAGLVGMRAQIGRVSEQIQGVKVFDLCATSDVTRDDVSRVHSVCLPDRHPGVIRRLGRRSHWVCQRMPLQDALNSPFTGQRVDFQLDELAPNGPCPNQSDLRQLKFAAHFDHQLFNLCRGFIDHQGCARPIGKIGMRIVVEDRPPLIEPLSRSFQISANVFSSLAIQATGDGFTSQVLFIRVYRYDSSMWDNLLLNDYVVLAGFCYYYVYYVVISVFIVMFLYYCYGEL